MFEVIRLYGGRPFALAEHLDRLERSAAAIELARPACRARARDRGAARGARRGDAQLRLIVTRGGRRIALIEPLVEHADTVSLATVTYAPTLILNGVKSLSYGANMQATRIAKGGGADEALLVRPDGIVLEAPTSTIFWVTRRRAANPGAATWGSSTRSPAAPWSRRSTWTRASSRSPTCWAHREAFLASTVARDPAGLGDRRDDVRARSARPPRRRGAAEGGRRRARGNGRMIELTDEQRLIAETARDFVDNEVVPRARDSDRAQKFDLELARRLGEMGYLGAPVAEEYGGRGLDFFSYGLIVEEVGRGDSAMRTVVSVQTSLVCGSIERWGSEEQKQRWLPKLTSGESFGCFGLTEPDTGSDAANLRTRAEKIDGGWRITGGKMWISLGNVAEVALIFAQTDPAKKHKGLACFLVPTESDGFSTQEIHGKLGLRASDTAEISLDGVEVGDDALMGEVGDGFKVAMSALDSGRYSVAAGCVGIIEGCVQASVAYAKERKQFDVPIASFQLVQEMIADMIVRRDAARMLVRRAGMLKDAGKPSTVETSVAKLYATESAVEAANLAIQVHGGSGYVDDYPVERYLRDARVTTLYEGTSQIQKLIIGRDATGINAMVPPSARWPRWSKRRSKTTSRSAV